MNRMIKFVLGTLFGGVIGVMWMCLASIVDDVDDLVEGMEEAERTYCPHCGCDLSVTVYMEDNCLYTKLKHCPNCGESLGEDEDNRDTSCL